MQPDWAASLIVASQQSLYLFKQLMGDNSLVLARVVLAPVRDLSEIKSVLQDLIERASILPSTFQWRWSLP